MVSVDDFRHVSECQLLNEFYLVRDNGAVLRLSKDNKRIRALDNNWTFGKLNQNGYLVISSVAIHRIVATVFHGIPPDLKFVVDHIDTNRQNNRPENLRWVSRLENIILNPITASRIIKVCGSIELFLENPSAFKGKFNSPDLSWMSSVSKEEADDIRNKMLIMFGNKSISQGQRLEKLNLNRNTDLRLNNHLSLFFNSYTENALHTWKTRTKFLCCPFQISKNPIYDYFLNLKIGIAFSLNSFVSYNIEEFAISDNHNKIWLICNSNSYPKPYALIEIAFDGKFFLHTLIDSYLTKNGATKEFNLIRGIDWTGGDTLDDYC
jgi:hypothetical protein